MDYFRERQEEDNYILSDANSGVAEGDGVEIEAFGWDAAVEDTA
jgi:hypothetical protein